MVAFIGAMTGLVFCSIPLVWLVLHYRYKKGPAASMSEEDMRQLDELMSVADSMAERIKNLESILDAEVPEWREQDGEA